MRIIKKRNPKKHRVRFRCDYCRSVFVAEENEYQAEKLPVSGGVYYKAFCPICKKETTKIPFL